MENHGATDKIEDENEPQRKQFSSGKLARLDSFDMENGKFAARYQHRKSFQAADWGTIMKLAFQCIGVVYGDIGTSPLYTFPGIFPNGIGNTDDILGVLSMIIYSLILILMIKYVFIVLAANDNGDGGTFALYSLICRHAKISLIPNEKIEEDKDISNDDLVEIPNWRTRRASAIKSFLERNKNSKYLLLFTTMLATSMVLGDGILTPCISVLSAVGGIQNADSSLSNTTVMWISVAILILLFQFQRFGTDKVGFTFSPILIIWFVFIFVIGIYNFIKYDPTVLIALNPWYIVTYFQRDKTNAWISLGGVVLCLTGSEALFADLGHFNLRSIQISTCGVVFPSVIMAYVGQASYLRINPQDASDAFYKSVPTPVYWPMLVVALLAAIIASQSLISASFSIVQQSLALGCFPRVKVVHTSPKYEGQVYVPEINHILMVACVAVTLGFQTTIQIGNAYGIAVVFVFTLTSSFLILVMLMIWKTNIIWILLYVSTISAVEYVYLSSVLYKFIQGGYLPIAFAGFIMSVMFIWNYVHRHKYQYELENKVSVDTVKKIASNPEIHRVSGVGLFYSELAQGISPIFTHYVDNVQSLHSVLVFVSIKCLPVGKIPAEERFLFRRVKPDESHIFRCVVRYGYKDVKTEGESFEETLLNGLKDFIRKDYIQARSSSETWAVTGIADESVVQSEMSKMSRIDADDEAAMEIQMMENECKKGGVIYMFGENEIVASKASGFGKKFVINHAYDILKRCLRQQAEVFAVPRKRLLKVGMTYEL